MQSCKGCLSYRPYPMATEEAEEGQEDLRVHLPGLVIRELSGEVDRLNDASLEIVMYQVEIDTETKAKDVTKQHDRHYWRKSHFILYLF